MFVTSDRSQDFEFGSLSRLRRAADAGATGGPTKTADTTPGMLFGTVGYMAPEQVRGRLSIIAPTSSRSARCSTRCCRAGVRSAATTTADTIRAILQEDPPDLPVSEANSAGLVRIVDRCLDKSPAARSSRQAISRSHSNALVAFRGGHKRLLSTTRADVVGSPGRSQAAPSSRLRRLR